MKYRIYIVAFLFAFCNNSLWGQERVYVSTDKDCYIAGEDVWCSVYCIDDTTGIYSNLSDVAYLQFISKEGVAGTYKIAMIGGRGCGKIRIPFGFATGNYSIVSYTKCCGGNSKSKFNGKIISIFNTLSTLKVKGGVIEGECKKNRSMLPEHEEIGITVGEKNEGRVPIKINNLGRENIHVNVSVYHADELEELSGSYNKVPLPERKGDFEACDETDYSGEVVTVKVTARNGSGVAGKYLYMSGVGNTDDVYVTKIGDNGMAVFKTCNIFGNRDVVFEVLSDNGSVVQKVADRDTTITYDIEILNKKYIRLVEDIPALEISVAMNRALKERNRRMQISRRFDSDTLYDMCKQKYTSFAGDTKPLVYNLDDYTRFPNLKETLREYVKFVRVRRMDRTEELKVLWETQGRCLVLLDGIPVSDHSIILGLDQQLVKQVVVYPKRYMLNHFIYDGVVNFITYKGNMAGVKLPKNVSIIEFDGVSYPQAFLGEKASAESDYPNFLSTIYWNPIVDLKKGETFEFNCILPQYKGNFKIVVEGVTETGKGILSTASLHIK